MTLNERLLAASDCWASANNRSVATLATKVVNDGKVLDRLRDGAGCTVATAERFFLFLRAPANWPDGRMPGEVGFYLDGVDLGGRSDHDDPRMREPVDGSPGNDSDITASVPA